MNKIIKLLIIWFVLGMCYFTLEGLYRIPQGGYANIAMLFVGGFCGLIVGSINQIPQFYKMTVWKQSIIGAIVVLIVEYISGYVLNIKMGLDIWDYSGMYFNINGQVCLAFAVIWFLLMPTAIWLEDWIRFKFWGEGTEYSLKAIYIEFIGGN